MSDNLQAQLNNARLDYIKLKDRYDHMERGAKDMLEQVKELSKQVASLNHGWVKVTEAYPKTYMDVLGGLWYDGTWLQGKCRLLPETDLQNYPQGVRWATFGPSHNAITHWALLPEPPVEEKG